MLSYNSLTAYCPKMPALGETTFGTAFEQNFGGKGANQAVQAARLGVRTALVGQVGSDSYGQHYLQALRREGVQVESISQAKDIATGIASIWVNEHGNNSIVIVPGANTLLTAQHIESARSLIEQSRVVVFQNEIPPEVTSYALQLCQEKKGAKVTIFNPAPADAVACQASLSLCDIICLNEVELQTISGLPIETVDDVIEASKRLLLRVKGHCKAIVATVGARGAILVSLPHYLGVPSDVPCPEPLSESELEVFFCPAEKVRAVDTVGAGDAFIGNPFYCLSCSSR